MKSWWLSYPRCKGNYDSEASGVPYFLERAQLLVFEDSKIPGGEDPLVTEWLKASLKKRKYKSCPCASTRRQ